MAYIHQVKYYECDRMGVTHHSNYVMTVGGQVEI